MERRKNGFLQHALFVAHDDFGRMQVHQLLQAVATGDDAAIVIVQIGRGEAAALEWNQRTQLRQKYGGDVK